jgi:hypothetical protein
MRKLFFMFLFCFTICLFSSAAYASQLETTNVEFTGGLDFDKERVSTFDDSKQISGSAQYGTIINITVSTVNFKGELEEQESYEIEVGKSGIFCQSIDLSVGENVVEITANKEGCEEFSKQVEVVRKKRVIKYELENGIYLPGGGI